MVSFTPLLDNKLQFISDTVRAYQGSEFTSTQFRNYATAVEFKIELSEVESHNSSGAGEEYHDPL